MHQVTIFNSPLINHKLATLKDKTTNNQQFRHTIHEISLLMIERISADWQTDTKIIQTPLAEQAMPVIKIDIVLIPILRAGLGMLSAFSEMLPNVKIGFAHFKRDQQTFKTQKNHFELPQIKPYSQIIILDPMIATGNTALTAIDEIKKIIKFPITIKVVGILGTNEGLAKIQQLHPDVQFFLAKKPEKLNSKAYISPGLGDAGDRLFGVE